MNFAVSIAVQFLARDGSIVIVHTSSAVLSRCCSPTPTRAVQRELAVMAAADHRGIFLVNSQGCMHVLLDPSKGRSI